ncbi:EAL domain-containing protein [Chitinibacter sp. SCUT-21]|uniref:bifunctional diguanylate cyclase/phosphodiesterase n=1 Tax=Chitinibacter sp. SCUT-21 TaxID=2970891 RepID=UPI0035A5AFF8
MTLRLQFLLGLTALFTALIIGLFIERVNSTKQYAESQLSATAQDAASSLAYPISRAIAKGDIILAETMIKSLLDRGYYQHIEIISTRGIRLAQMQQNKTIEGVPEWFIHQFPLNLTPGNALISDGWKQMGRVVVTSEPAIAYKQLWLSLKHTAFILLLVYVCSLFAMFFLVRLLLRPLSAIEHSAHEVQQRRFNAIDYIPSTREFRSVVAAFNLMLERVRQFLSIEQQRAEEYRHQAFTDPTSGLDNRRSVDLRLGDILANHPKGMTGSALALQIDNLIEINQLEGYPGGDALIRELAAALKDCIGEQASICSRLNGSTLFALFYSENADQAFQKVDDFLLAVRSITIKSTRPIRYGIALVEFAATTNKGQLLGALDLALQQAIFSGGENFQHTRLDTEHAEQPSGSQAWREILQAAIRQKSWHIKAQAVQDLQLGRLHHYELTTVLLHHEANPIKAALFVPMAARHGLLEKTEQSVFDYAIEKINQTAHEIDQAFALNIGLLGTLGSIEGQDTFIKQLNLLVHRRSQIYFEVPEHQIVAHPELAKRLAKLLHDLGFKFGIDHFGFSAAAASLLPTLRPDYIKIDRRLVNDMADHEDTRKMLMSLLEVAHSLNISTIAQGLETEAQLEQLKSMKFNAAQGYLIGKPAEFFK